jgi:hypothetical protein
MVTMFFITVMSPSVPTVTPVLAIFAFARPDIVVFRARYVHGLLWYVHGLLFNPHLGWLVIDRYLNTVDDGAAALHVLRIVAWLGRHAFTDHRACYRTNGGRRGATIPVPDLVAEQTAGNASNDCAAGLVAALLHLNLFVPALLARALNCLIFGCKRRCGQGEG